MMQMYNYPVIQMDKTGENLKDLRKKSGVKVTEICDYLGISPQAIYKWERGICLPSVDCLVALAHYYHVTVENLLVCEEVKMASSFYILRESNESDSQSVFYLVWESEYKLWI